VSGSNADRLRDMFEQFWKRGDPTAGRSVLADDIEWFGLDEVALGGERHGPREVGGFFAEWLEMWEDYDNDVEFFEVTPDIILALNRFRGRAKGSGIELESQLGQVWEFRDGRAVRQTMYRTHDEARRAAEELVRG
jgi:ketosteroid isomerase-like protein